MSGGPSPRTWYARWRSPSRAYRVSGTIGRKPSDARVTRFRRRPSAWLRGGGLGQRRRPGFGGRGTAERRQPDADDARDHEEEADGQDRDRQVASRQEDAAGDRANRAGGLHRGPEQSEDAAAHL